jgi:TM2 domain-containing membrane protein YozV
MGTLIPILISLAGTIVQSIGQQAKNQNLVNIAQWAEDAYAAIMKAHNDPVTKAELESLRG